MTEQRVREALRKAGLAEADRVEREVSLYETGAMDSFVMLQLLINLEAEFGIEIQNGEVLPENLDSIGRIAAFVARKQAGVE